METQISILEHCCQKQVSFKACGSISNESKFLFSLEPVLGLPFLDMLVRLAVLIDGSVKIFKLLFLLNLHTHILVRVTQVYKFC